jgi:hypothetical protein
MTSPRSLTTVLVAAAALVAASPAAAGPVATNDGAYSVLGRVFPDPMAGCQQLGSSPCDPNAQGNLKASSFIQIEEFIDALQYMNTTAGHAEWKRYMEVLPLDGKIRANGTGQGVPDGDMEAGDTPGDEMFPGNTLPLEFDPHPQFQSAGLPTSDVNRQKSDLLVVRVTDENVPDEGKKRYALSLSIHGIERAGAEGGIRAIEDLVTAATTESQGDGETRLDDPIVPAEVKPGAPTFRDVLEKSIVYFTFPNPDGWRRGSFTNLVPSFQRYNGNGVDPNRDWPDLGYAFRGYSASSEPETRAFIRYYRQTEDNAGEFTAGDDLHGQPDADALSYTLLPHGAKDFAKDLRAREVSKRINRGTFEAVKWHPRVQENDQPVCGTGVPAPVPIGDDCPKIYGQTWGTVYDTINYTTTGALGDWFDSPVGLGGDGIDNEMSFSHLDRDTTFIGFEDKEQLHVAGNKALIYARLTEILEPPSDQFAAPGRKGYVPNTRLTRAEQNFQEGPPPGTVAQAEIDRLGTPAQNVFPFDVKRGPQPADGSPDAGKDIFNGGMRIDITVANAAGESTGTATLDVQCRFCDDHPGTDPDGDQWVTVAEDFNQSNVYRQAGITAIVNRPQVVAADGTTPVQWRAVVGGLALEDNIQNRLKVTFFQGPASDDGATGGDEPPVLRGYDIANTDFFPDLNPHIPGEENDFSAIDPRKVISGEQSLTGLSSLVLADSALPGYRGGFEGETPPPSGPPTADKEFQSERPTAPGQGPEACEVNEATTETYDFSIGPNDANDTMEVRVRWVSPTSDYDVHLLRNGSEVGSSAAFLTTSETILLELPPPGDYTVQVVNCSAPPTDPWSGTVKFRPLTPDDPDYGGPSSYTAAEKDAWFDAVRAFVEGGGNLVLTDGALRALSELSSVPGDAVERRTVYAGQVAFDKSDEDDDETIHDPLAEDPVTINQLGARYNSGFRRQTYEPSPLGFFVDSTIGSAARIGARQFDVAGQAFEDAGGRVVGTSVSSRGTSVSHLYDRVAMGELPLGKGQIRILGALLPRPSQKNDHPLGLAPYGVSYTGYILMRNLLEVKIAGPGGGGGGAGAGAGGAGDGGQAGTGLRCVNAAGTARGAQFGRVRLGRSRAVTRQAYAASIFYRRNMDRFCLTGDRTLRVGYVRGRAVLILSDSRRFSVKGVRPGMTARAFRRRFGRARGIRVGSNVWHLRRGRRARLVFKLSRGRVREVGIANRRLTSARRQSARFLRSFN